MEGEHDFGIQKYNFNDICIIDRLFFHLGELNMSNEWSEYKVAIFRRTLQESKIRAYMHTKKALYIYFRNGPRLSIPKTWDINAFMNDVGLTENDDAYKKIMELFNDNLIINT